MNRVDKIRKAAGLILDFGLCELCSRRGTIVPIRGHWFCLTHAARIRRKQQRVG